MRAAAAALVAIALLGAGVLVGRATARDDEPLRLRPGDIPVSVDAVVDGTLEFRVRAWQCGIVSVLGDHADFLADGQYCHVRLRLSSLDRPVVTYRYDLQELVDADGTTYPAESDGVQINDQPTTAKVPLLGSIELDVWFDVPEDADIVAVKVRADETTPGVTVPLPQ